MALQKCRAIFCVSKNIEKILKYFTRYAIIHAEIFKIMEIDDVYIDYGYIDIHNTDITF